MAQKGFEYYKFISQQCRQEMAEIYGEKYNLTDYREHRLLELQFCKIKDENQQLKLKIGELENLYQESIAQSIQEHTHLKQHYSSIERNYQEAMSVINRIMAKIASAGSAANEELSSFENDDSNHDKECLGLAELQAQIYRIIDNSVENNKNFQNLVGENEERERIWRQKQDQRSQEFVQLQMDLDHLSQLQQKLKIENNQLLHQNQQLTAQIKSYKTMAIQARNAYHTKSAQTQSNDTSYCIANTNVEDDANFALDLISYEKQLLVRLFQLIEKSFHDEEIEICLKRIFGGYEDVIESYRQKLQIQYDLEDLQCEYRKEQAKSSKLLNSQQEQGLIELKKEIIKFRKELQNQKEGLYHKEDILQQRVNDLSGQSVHDHRLKSYTINLQTKLYKRKHHPFNESDEKAEAHKDCNERSLQWKQTLEADKKMQDVIEKDRENLERILKETRSKYYKPKKQQ